MLGVQFKNNKPIFNNITDISNSCSINSIWNSNNSIVVITRTFRILSLMFLSLSVCLLLSDQQMMTRPVSAVGYRRPLSQHARMAMMMRPEPRYKVRRIYHKNRQILS